MTEPYHLITDRKYLPSLEGWRGVMALLVVLFHYYSLFSNRQFAGYGYLSVDFFFILSGFIISRQYEADIALHRITFRQFAIRRLARLYPLYIVSIMLFLAANALVVKLAHIPNLVDFGMGPTFGWRIFLLLTMLGNIGGWVEPWNGAAWSVSVEWVVNLLFFALVWYFRRLPNFLLWVAILLCTVYLVDVSPHTLHLYVADKPVFNLTIARGIVGFSLGSLIFRHHRLLPILPLFSLYVLEILLVAASATLLYFHDYPFVISVDYVFQLMFFPMFITVSLYRNGLLCWLFSLPQFRFLGRISYSIYLLQIPVGYAFRNLPYFSYLDYPISGFMLLIILIAISTLSYFLIEKPFRLLGHRLTKP